MRIALIVGINHYEHGGSLYGCVDDAHAVQAVLARHGDGSVNFDCGMQIKFHPNGNDLLGWLGSSLPDLYLKSHPNASQRPSNGRKTPEPCE
ncbi:TPA: caspase family protein [Pseudomonas aeruginosa]|uniref:caspase family protein n=1 Tax=Pseudomonas aeruginosa TaxID=287 RepID=UPI0021F9D814|nr:hypothetical protein KBCPHODN_00021 [Pseudomonas aeruginosa]